MSVDVKYSKDQCRNEVILQLQDISHASVRTVLEDALHATREPAHLLQTESGEDAFYFQLVCFLPNGVRVSERALWERASDFEDCRVLALDYMRQVGKCGAGPSTWPLWHDEWIPAGSYALAPLTFKCAEVLTALVEHARTCDLDHAEVFTSWIHLLLRHHGWSEDTRQLLLHRCTDISGPDPMENLVLAVGDLGFREWLAAHDDLETFCRDARDIVGREDRFEVVKKVRQCLYVGDDAGHARALNAARERQTDMFGRFPTKLRYARFRYSSVPWDHRPEAGER